MVFGFENRFHCMKRFGAFGADLDSFLGWAKIGDCYWQLLLQLKENLREKN